MSLMLMAKAFGVRVGSASSKLVLLKLADNANDQGECWPSYKHIADQCEMSRRSAMTHIDALCAAGFIEKRTRKGPKGNSSNVYIVVLDKAEVSPHGEYSAPPSDAAAPHGEYSAPPHGEKSAPGISHSFEPVIESVSEPVKTCAPKAAPDISAEVLAYLNEKADRNFRNAPTNTKLILARAKEGATLEDFRAVIDRKCKEWVGNPKFEQYLRPATLFNAEKFNNYVGQLDAPLPASNLVDGTSRFAGRHVSVDDHNREVAMRWAAGGDFYDQE